MLNIIMPKFSLGWEFESITDIKGNDGSHTGAACSDCEACGEEEYGDCPNRDGSPVIRRSGIKEIAVQHDGSVGGAQLEFILAYGYIHNPAAGIEALQKLLLTKVSVDASCGFHVHVGLPSRVPPSRSLPWAGWFETLGRLIEKEMWKAVPENRRRLPAAKYCGSLLGSDTPISKREFSSNKSANHRRYTWINTVEMFRPGGIRTVEIRAAGNVRHYAYCMGWIAFCYQLARSAWTLAHDVSFLQNEAQTLKEFLRIIETRLLIPETAKLLIKRQEQTALMLLARTGITQTSAPIADAPPALPPIPETSPRPRDVLSPGDPVQAISYHSCFRLGDIVTAHTDSYAVTRAGVLCRVAYIHPDRREMGVVLADGSNLERYNVDPENFTRVRRPVEAAV